jgi:hypothetical protein
VTIATLRVFKSIDAIIAICYECEECPVGFGAMTVFTPRRLLQVQYCLRGNMLARGSNVDPLRGSTAPALDTLPIEITTYDVLL